MSIIGPMQYSGQRCQSFELVDAKYTHLARIYVVGGDVEAARKRAGAMDAAPDLLDALKGILAITDRNHVAWEKARAAIAKAEQP